MNNVGVAQSRDDDRTSEALIQKVGMTTNTARNDSDRGQSQGMDRAGTEIRFADIFVVETPFSLFSGNRPASVAYRGPVILCRSMHNARFVEECFLPHGK